MMRPETRTSPPKTDHLSVYRKFLLSRRQVWLFLLLLLEINVASAQLTEQPLPAKIKHTARPKTVTLRTKDEVKVISLPFWDDFSTVPDTMANLSADTLHWINSASVTISSGTGINAPSLNVATFNGLDSLNTPYSLESSTKGFADKLISLPIRMGEPEVTIADRDSVYLSFFYQWRGGLEPPDDEDFIQVEFRTDAGMWEVVDKIFGDNTLEGNEFYMKMIKVNEDRFFHNAFQFRFRSFGRLSGPFDAWNIDYVYLNKHRDESETYFPDQAISRPLSSIFGRYRAIPLWQFRSNPILTAPTTTIRNLNNVFDVVDHLVHGTFLNYLDSTGIPVITTKQLTPDSIPQPGFMVAFDTADVALGEGEGATPITSMIDPNDPDQFHPDARYTDFSIKFTALTADLYEPDGDVANDYSARLNEFKFLVDFRVNDTVSSTYHLRNFLAYDDGVAEYSVRLGQPGNRAALGFELPIAVDTLTGFYIYFPHYGGSASQVVDFYFYEDAGGEPAEKPLKTLFSRNITKNNSNTFSLVNMEQDPLIVSNVFYIGWKEPSVTDRLHVGLDKSQNTSDMLFESVSGSWLPATQITGSVMIRPVFGSGSNIPPLSAEDNKSSVNLHPNPCNGTFFIDSKAKDLQLTDVTGKGIGFTLEEIGTEKKITLFSGASGIYIVRWKEGMRMHARKILVN